MNCTHSQSLVMLRRLYYSYVFDHKAASRIRCQKHWVAEAFSGSCIRWLKHPLYKVFSGSSICWLKHPLKEVFSGSSICWLKHPLKEVFSGSSICWLSSRGLALMHSTQTNVVLVGSRPTADHWWRQEGHPKMLVPELKSPQRHPPSPKELGETDVRSRE